MPTVRELADTLGVSPQAVRDFAKRELHCAVQPRRALQLTDEQASVVAAHFVPSTASLQSTSAKHAAKSSANCAKQSDADFAALQTECAVLRERVAGLEEQLRMLREQADEARQDKATLAQALADAQRARQPWWRRLLPASRGAAD